MTFASLQLFDMIMECFEVIFKCIGVLDEVFWAVPAQHGPIEFTHSNRRPQRSAGLGRVRMITDCREVLRVGLIESSLESSLFGAKSGRYLRATSVTRSQTAHEVMQCSVFAQKSARVQSFGNKF